MNVKDIRVENLIRIVDGVGGNAAAQKKFGVDATYISQLRNKHRSFGEKAARNMEVAFGLRVGELDYPEGQVPSNAVRYSPSLLKDVALHFNLGEESGAYDHSEAIDLVPQYLKRLGVHVADPEAQIRAAHPDDPVEEGMVLIKESKVRFKGGPGHDLVYEIVEDSEPATYRLSWFQQERLNPKRCVRFKLSGESNEPFAFLGDSILVNLDETNIRNGKVYAFWHEGEGRRMKKLFRRPDGSLILNSFNTTYPDEIISAEEAAEKLTIIGRVRERSGKGGL